MEDIGKLIDGAGKLAGILHKLRHTAQGDEEQTSLPHRAGLGVQIQDTAQNHHHGDGQVVDEVHRRAHGGAVVVRLIVGIHGVRVAQIEPPVQLRLPVIGLNGSAAGEHFLRIAVELAQLSGAGAEQRPDALGAEPGIQHGCRHRDQKHRDHGSGDVPHKNQ